MSRMRVLQVNLHLHEEGCVVAVQEVGWKGHHRTTALLQRTYVGGVGLNATPSEVLAAVAGAFALTEPEQEATDPA